MKRPKKEHHEEHADETWLIPYSDLLTLLLALFIVLFAVSQTDKNKLATMAQVFNDILKGQTGILQNMTPFSKVQPDVSNATSEKSEKASEPKEEQAIGENAAKEDSELMQLKDEVEEFANTNNLPGFVTTRVTGEGLMISIQSVALFSSGSAVLLPEGVEIANGIAKLLEKYSQTVVVGGHTDDVPYSSGMSNWDLSTNRALTFMKQMLNDPRLNPSRFSAAGYGEYHPIVPNISEKNKQENRRVEILVERKAYKKVN